MVYFVGVVGLLMIDIYEDWYWYLLKVELIMVKV